MAIFDSKFSWFPMPNHIIVDPLDKDTPGPWSTFSVGELRLYPVLYMACNNKGHFAVITNKYLRTLSGLNRTSLPKVIESLETRNLIKATPVDKRGEEYRYEILDLDGRPMTSKSGPMPTKAATDSMEAPATTATAPRYVRRRRSDKVVTVEPFPTSWDETEEGG